MEVHMKSLENRVRQVIEPRMDNIEKNLKFVSEIMSQMAVDSAKRKEEVDKAFKEMAESIGNISNRYDKREEKLDKSKRELDNALKKMAENVGGIGNSNGFYTEEFFFTALENEMSFAGHDFEYIHKKLFRYSKRKNLRGEYDIVMVNSNTIIVFELKYKLTTEYVNKFYHKSLKKFKELFPEYAHLKLYGAVASMSDPENARELASKYGLYVVSQHGQKIKIIDHNVCEYQPGN